MSDLGCVCNTLKCEEDLNDSVTNIEDTWEPCSLPQQRERYATYRGSQSTTEPHTDAVTGTSSVDSTSADVDQKDLEERMTQLDYVFTRITELIVSQFEVQSPRRKKDTRIWDLIVSVPDHCLSFYFIKCSDKEGILKSYCSDKTRRYIRTGTADREI